MKKKIIVVVEILLAAAILAVLVTIVNVLTNKEDVEGPDRDEEVIDYKEIPEGAPISKYDAIIESCAEEFDIPLGLLYAVIECESSFRPECTSSVGAKGLMQLMPATFSDSCKWAGFDYTYDQVTDPAVNVRVGSYYLKRMYNMFDDWELAVAAYNAGPGNVQKWLKNEDYEEDGKLVYIPFTETSRHVQKVNKAWEKYDKILKG